jgi:hypothetical protein
MVVTRLPRGERWRLAFNAALGLIFLVGVGVAQQLAAGAGVAHGEERARLGVALDGHDGCRVPLEPDIHAEPGRRTRDEVIRVRQTVPDGPPVGSEPAIDAVDPLAEAEDAEPALYGDAEIRLERRLAEEPGLDRVIRTGYSLLGLQTYFTAGVKEVRAWTIHKGDTAPQAAAVIHTDFEKGFIRAEVIAYDDFVSLKGEHGAKEAGKMKLEGKDYIVRDGDVMHFRFNV